MRASQAAGSDERPEKMARVEMPTEVEETPVDDPLGEDLKPEDLVDPEVDDGEMPVEVADYLWKAEERPEIL
eukprot:7679367-Alexandrium_andersonii.AAC.1